MTTIHTGTSTDVSSWTLESGVIITVDEVGIGLETGSNTLDELSISTSRVLEGVTEVEVGFGKAGQRHIAVELVMKTLAKTKLWGVDIGLWTHLDVTS